MACAGLFTLATASTVACSDKAKEVKAEVKQAGGDAEASDGSEKAETKEKVVPAAEVKVDDEKSMAKGPSIDVLAFTDIDRMHAYAKSRKQLNSDGTMLGMSVPSTTSFPFFESLVGIEGVRFNQGDNGWFAPTANLRGIHSYLIKGGQLP